MYVSYASRWLTRVFISIPTLIDTAQCSAWFDAFTEGIDESTGAASSLTDDFHQERDMIHQSTAALSGCSRDHAWIVFPPQTTSDSQLIVSLYNRALSCPLWQSRQTLLLNFASVVSSISNQFRFGESIWSIGKTINTPDSWQYPSWLFSSMKWL